MDLSKLSIEQKKELLEKLKTRELVAKEKVLETFIPHKGQLPYLFSQSTITAVFCGNGWGKTTILAIRLILDHYPELWDSLKKHFPKDFTPPIYPVKHDWFFISGFDKVDDYWIEIQKWCPPSKLPKPDKMGTSAIKRLNWAGNTYTTFYSHDQDAKKAESTNIDGLKCDEPPPRDLWIAAYRGLRSQDEYQVFIAGTPISEPWLYDEIYMPWALKQDKNILVIEGATFDNPHLSKKWLEDFQARLTDDEKETRLYGKFKSLQGRVFKEFTRQTHVFMHQKWPEEWPVWCAIDPHPRKDHVAVYLGVTPDDILVVIDELKVQGTVEDLAEALKKKETENGYRIVCRRIDNSGSGTDWNRDSVISTLDRWSRENNYSVRVSPMRKSEKDVSASIQKIKLLLKNDQLRFLENCVHTISDMERYQWADYRNPESAGIKEAPKKIHDDTIDCLRYLVMSNPAHSPSMSVLSMFGEKTPYSRNPFPR